MFLLANKEKLRKSLIVNDDMCNRVKRGNIITSTALIFSASGAAVIYLLSDASEQTRFMLFGVIFLNVVAWFLILDNFLEVKFLKGLLKEQSPENIFDEEEWQKIQEAAQRQGVSDRAINESLSQK